MPTGLEGKPREAQHALLQRPCSLSRVCLKALIPIQSQKQINSLYHSSCRKKNSPPTSDLFRVHISTSKCTKLCLQDRVSSIVMFLLHLQTFPVAWGFLFYIPSVLISCLFWLFKLLCLLESNCPGAVNVSVNTCFRWVDLSGLRKQMTLTVGLFKGCLFRDFVAESCLNKNQREIFTSGNHAVHPSFSKSPGCSSSDLALGGTN